MNRRRFLKYAAAGVAVGGAALAGYEFDRFQNSLVPQKTTTITKTQSVRETITETLRLASLHGRLFFDYNGNGMQDGEEPAIAGAAVGLRDEAGRTVAKDLTDSSGDYAFDDVKAGWYRLHIQAGENFRYMCTSPKDFRLITEGYDVVFQTETVSKSVGLMEGFLTLPLSPKTKYSIGRFYDWDPDPKRSLWWNGRVGNEPWNHSGIDYDIREGEDVVAPAPGFLYPIERGPQGQIALGLHHPDAGISTCYNHLSTVSEKALVKGFVSRGEKIAETGSTGASYPHLHFNTAQRILSHDAFLDPYRPLFTLKDKYNGYWAREQGKDFWQSCSGGTNPNLENLWTKDNDPRHASP